MAARTEPRRALAIVALSMIVGCQGAKDDPRCMARADLLAAARLIEMADAAEVAGDPEAVAGYVDDARSRTRTARERLRSTEADPAEGAARRILEAANYLSFIADDYELSGRVDGSLVQFATRLLNSPNIGETPPLSC